MSSYYTLIFQCPDCNTVFEEWVVSLNDKKIISCKNCGENFYPQNQMISINITESISNATANCKI